MGQLIETVSKSQQQKKGSTKPPQKKREMTQKQANFTPGRSMRGNNTQNVQIRVDLRIHMTYHSLHGSWFQRKTSAAHAADWADCRHLGRPGRRQSQGLNITTYLSNGFSVIKETKAFVFVLLNADIYWFRRNNFRQWQGMMDRGDPFLPHKRRESTDIYRNEGSVGPWLLEFSRKIIWSTKAML